MAARFFDSVCLFRIGLFHFECHIKTNIILSLKSNLLNCLEFYSCLLKYCHNVDYFDDW